MENTNDIINLQDVLRNNQVRFNPNIYVNSQIANVTMGFPTRQFAIPPPEEVQQNVKESVSVNRKVSRENSYSSDSSHSSKKKKK